MDAEIQAILDMADVRINGKRDWDIQIHDERFWRRVILYGDIGLGDAYMDGWWDCQRLDEFLYRILKVVSRKRRQPWRINLIGTALGKLFNLQSLRRAFQVGERHYDLGNDFFRAIIGESMVYSCAYWQAGAETLEEAQRDKLELVCRKVGLKPGMRVLDIGCGWGSFCKYAVVNYDVEAVGLTVSREQVSYAEEKFKDYPIEILLRDYRTYKGKFDAIVSIGMFEHIGPKNYDQFMSMVTDNLREEGIFLLHTIGGNQTRISQMNWLTKHIFVNGFIPSIQQIAKSVEKRFVVEDLHNFGKDYDRTLLNWHTNFERAWPELQKQNPMFDQRFYRMWRYYLLCCAGSFRARDQQVWQWVLSSNGLPEGYRRPSF